MTTQAFEKLGMFYLGKPVDPGTGALGTDFLMYDARDLVTQNRGRLAADVPGEQVGSADPRRARSHERVTRAESGKRLLDHRHGSVVFDPNRLHGNTAYRIPSRRD